MWTLDRVQSFQTTPLINLVGVDLLDILPAWYGEIYISHAVYEEFAVGKNPGDPELAKLSWLKIVSTGLADANLTAQLDAGEAATLSLALAQNARAVILDEPYGRKIARQRGLPVIGTLSVLLAAKRSGLLPALGSVISDMILQGRHISPILREQILRAAGE